MTPTEPSAPSPRTLATLLYASAAVTAVVALVLGLLVSPILFALALFVPVDLWLARAYGSGRRPTTFGQSGDPTADPSYNPYARED